MRDMETIRRLVGTPAVIMEKENYCIKFAETPDELNAVFKLRYEVFHQEQKRAHKTSGGGLDMDDFDDYCLHLLVLRKDTSAVVGTYRIHFGSLAEHSALGFYSEQEYRIDGIREIAPTAIEVGRSCVAAGERNGTVMALLWSGISATLARSGQRYLLGCVSLEEASPADAWLLYEYFRTETCCSDSIRAFPLAGYELERPEPERGQPDLTRAPSLLPPLLKGYLRLGAKICGEPAFDPDFGSIDFFIVLDVRSLPERYSKHFNVKNAGCER